MRDTDKLHNIVTLVVGQKNFPHCSFLWATDPFLALTRALTLRRILLVLNDGTQLFMLIFVASLVARREDLLEDLATVLVDFGLAFLRPTLSLAHLAPNEEQSELRVEGRSVFEHDVAQVEQNVEDYESNEGPAHGPATSRINDKLRLRDTVAVQEEDSVLVCQLDHVLAIDSEWSYDPKE